MFFGSIFNIKYYYNESLFQTSRWYPLLHTQYQRAKPELRVGIYIDEDKGGGETAFKAKEAPARPGPGRGQGRACYTNTEPLDNVFLLKSDHAD